MQAIRNPEARHRVHSRLLTAARYTDKLVREIKKRPGKKAAWAVVVVVEAWCSRAGIY